MKISREGLRTVFSQAKSKREDTMKHFILGTVLGFSLGYVFATQAQCCAMFDVDLNTQIEIEHAIQTERFLSQPWRPAAPLFEEPCRR